MRLRSDLLVAAVLRPDASLDVLIRTAVDELPEEMRIQAAAMASETRHGDAVRVLRFLTAHVLSFGGKPVEPR